MSFGSIGKSISHAVSRPFQQAGRTVQSVARNPIAGVINPVQSAVGRAGSAFGNVGKASGIGDISGGIQNVGHALGDTYQGGKDWAVQHKTELGLVNPITAGPVGWQQANKALIQDPKRKQEFAAEAESNAAQGLANDQNSLINQVRSQFGSTGVGQQRNALMQATRQQAQDQASLGFGGALNQQRINAARSGQLGGSTDQAATGGLLGQYYNTLAQGAVGATNAGQQFDQALQQQRLATENAIRGSSINDLSGMRGDLASLINASGRGQITQNALGNALPQLASQGSNLALMRAMGQG